MIAHAGLLVKNYAKAKAFYTKVLATVGYQQNLEFGEAAGFMEGGQTSFWIAAEKKMAPGHVAFEAKNKKEVDAFYRVAMKAGAKDNGKPGYRPHYWSGYYAAFVLDADGNNVEAVWFDYSKVKKAKPATVAKKTASKKVTQKIVTKKASKKSAKPATSGKKSAKK